MGAAGWGPRSLFLRGLAAAFLAAFASLYLQIPGLYGRNGILPARRVLRPSGKGLWEQLWDVPTLLWLGPHLGLDTEQGMELLCLLGTLGAFCALAWESLRSCLVFALLWIFYLSLYQVGQVFLYFQWDSLLLEAGFLGVLVAPLLPRGSGGVSSCSPHEPILLWLPRWLLFRLMFASGVVKLSSRCPAWWGLTALTHHFQSQCLPTPAAWLAHHLPLWLHKLGVVATFAIEVALPPLFFLPLRRLRLFAFCCQVLLQVLIILTGNYNFFNLLTLALACSLLDHRPPAGGQPPSTRPPPPAPRPSPPALGPFLLGLLELCLGGSLLCWGGRCFGLAIDWDKWIIDSRVAFTYHEFSGWLRAVTLPLAGVALLSLCWEILLGLYRCLHTRGCWGKLWATLQWALVVTATLGVFTVSLVPYTQMDPESGGRLWPGARRLFGAVERFQVVNSYGLFRRMTGLGGRPEVVLEGTQDGQNWREIEFMYKPGNLSVAPPVVAPHQPRLDWQMWFAALGPPSSSPWLFSLVNRLLQGQEEVEVLVQQDQSQYPFSDRPPRLIRAQLYRYWFTPPGPNSPPGAWWVRQHVQEFLPPLALGDPTLETFLGQHRLQDKLPPRPPPAAPLPVLLQRLRRLSRPCSGPALICSLYLAAATLCLLPGPGRRPRGGPWPPAPHKARGAPQRNGEAGREQRGEGRPRGGNEGSAEGQRGAKRKK